MPVLVLGSYDPTKYPGNRIIEAPSSAAICTKGDSLTRLERALNLLVNPPEHEPMDFRMAGLWDLGEIARSKKKIIAVDIETSGDVSVDRVEDATLLSVGLFVDGVAWVISEETLKLKMCKKLLGQILARNLCVLHNGKFDIPYLEHYTGRKVMFHFDTMLAHYALFPASQHGLKPLSRSILGADDWDGANEKYTVGKTYKEAGTGDDGIWWDARRYSAKSGYERIPRTLLYEYNGYDVYWTMKLFWHFRWELEHDEAAMRVFNRRMELSNMFMDIEKPGNRIDVPHLERMGGILEQQRDIELGKLEEIAGRKINPASPKQVKEWLLDAGIHTSSTDEKHMTEIIRNNLGRFSDLHVAFAKQLLVCRGITKNLGTYVNGFLQRAHGDRIYTKFKLIGSYMGRLSTPAPAIMTLPRDPLYRQMLLPDEGHVILGPDYGQIEARVMACLSGDPYLLSLFQKDSEDFFDALMPIAYPNTDLSTLDKDTKKDMRARLKGIIYGLSYGRKAHAIADSLDMSVLEAQAIIDNYLGAAPVLDAWRKEVQRMALEAENLETLFGFHFQCEIVTGENKTSVENSALAFLPQSTANDICLEAALAIHKWIGSYGARIMGTIHDQILVSCPPEHVEEVGLRMQQEMEDSAERALGTQCVFDAKPDAGPDWANLIAMDKYLAAA
jgi:DNA polymerase-1